MERSSEQPAEQPSNSAAEPDAPGERDAPVVGEAPAPDGLKAAVIEALKTVFDPEIPVNIYELGLIYEVEVDDALGEVRLTMTLTTPACPVAEMLPGQVESVVRQVPGVTEAAVDLVWDPPWSPDRMTEAAKLELGLV